MSQPVREFMTPMPKTIGVDINIKKARNLMLENSCHHLPVLQGGKLVGILSDRDLNTVEKLSQTDGLTAGDVMTAEPITVLPTDDVFQVAMKMHQEKIGSVIVRGFEKEPWGIFTATDALGYFSQKSEDKKC